MSSSLTEASAPRGENFLTSLIRAAGVFVVHGFCLALVCFGVAAYRYLLPLLKEFDVALPTGTVMAIDLYEATSQWWWCLVPGLVGGTILYFMLIRAGSLWGWLASLWAMTVPVLTTTVLAWLLVFATLPLPAIAIAKKQAALERQLRELDLPPANP